MKYIVTGDWHTRGLAPRARLDDFWTAFEAKLREVFALADAERANAIICPGDVMDSPNAGYAVVGRLFRLLRESPCEIWTVFGNHDEIGANPSTRERTPLGLLIEAKMFRDLETDPPPGVASGHGYDTETDHDITQYLSPNGESLRIAHGMALERAPGIETMRYTLLADIAAQPNAPRVLCVGHEHIGFGIKKIGETLFINPGALLRLSAHPAEFERRVQVAVLEVDGSNVDARLVPLQSARPGSEVLSRAHLEAAALREERTAEFMALLDAQDELRRLEVSEIVTRIAGAEGLPEAVRAEALRRIAAAAEGGRAA